MYCKKTLQPITESSCTARSLSWNSMFVDIITFHASRRRREMCIGHARLCVCLSLAAFPHYCTDPDVISANDRGWPLIGHYWVDLPSVHGIRCYDNRARYTSACTRSVPGFVSIATSATTTTTTTTTTKTTTILLLLLRSTQTIVWILQQQNALAIRYEVTENWTALSTTHSPITPR